MMFFSGIIGFLLVLTAEARVGNSSELPFCTETEQCLLFDLVCQTGNNEVRHYESVKWVSTDEKSFFMEFAAMKSFQRLFDYITGSNDKGAKIAMTAPVLVRIPDKKFWEMGVYTMSFLLPAEHQTNPPTPTNKKVYIQETQDMTVYVRSYSGWMSTMSDKNAANSLFTHLDSVDAQYKKGFHYAAGYNSPMTLLNRHNEVWLAVVGEPVCSSED